MSDLRVFAFCGVGRCAGLLGSGHIAKTARYAPAAKVVKYTRFIPPEHRWRAIEIFLGLESHTRTDRRACRPRTQWATQMREFKMPPGTLPTRRHDNWMVGLVSIGAVLLGLGILFFIVYGPRSVVRPIFPILRWSIVLLILCDLATVFVAMQRIPQRVRHELTFLLNENELIRKRPGFPDVQISLPQFISLYEKSGCLVVAGGNPLRRIAIPKKVENFKLLQVELMKYASPAPPPRRSSLGWITSVLTIICW